jgi:four helix bundle protein
MADQDLRARTKLFANRVLALVAALPPGRRSNIIANQLGRAGSAVGANYRAACRARSRKEFIAKLGIVEEESDESGFWIEIIQDQKLMTVKQTEDLKQEAYELLSIMIASQITARRKRRDGRE